VWALIDATDRLEPRHRRRLRAALDQERARLAEYDRLTIARLRASAPQEPQILMSLCAPRDPQRANPLFENPKLVEARWRDAFASVIDRAAGRAGSGGSARASPIAAGLRAIAADPDFSAAIPSRRIVLISDLLEHDTEGFSLYAEGADFAAFLASGGAPPDLGGVSVRVVTLDRPEEAAAQAAARAGFWEPYFSTSGAEDVQFDPAP
jgi:hypothetical protein